MWAQIGQNWQMAHWCNICSNYGHRSRVESILEIVQMPSVIIGAEYLQFKRGLISWWDGCTAVLRIASVVKLRLLYASSQPNTFRHRRGCLIHSLTFFNHRSIGSPMGCSITVCMLNARIHSVSRLARTNSSSTSALMLKPNWLWNFSADIVCEGAVLSVLPSISSISDTLQLINDTVYKL